MSKPKWFIVARNEYRVRTSSIRVMRPFLPVILIGILVAFVLYIAPVIGSFFTEDFLVPILSEIAISLVEFMLFMFFLAFLTIPITYTLRDVQTGQQELFLAAPIKPSDILLGEFLGELSLYAIIIALITGSFTALLKPLGLNMIQIGVTVIIFAVTLSSALWIGTVIAALLRTKIGGSSRGKDIGKALSIIIILPVVAFMYAVMGRGFETLFDPQTSIVKTLLGLFPSSWGSDIIVAFVSHPGDMAAVGWEILTRLGGLLIFFAAALYIGMKLADRAYSLEPTTFSPSTARADNIFSRKIKKKGGFSILFVAIFKVYIRRLQNLSWLTYIVGIFIIMRIFLIQPDSIVGADVFFFPLLATMVACDITIRGKETLFIYRKTPNGENRYLKAMLLKGWVVAVPLAVVLTVISALLSNTSLNSLVVNAGIAAFMVAADIAFASGLFLLMPAYTERGGEFLIDVMIVLIVSFGLLAVSLFFFRETLHELMGLTAFHWIVGIAFIFLGKTNLQSSE
jgi:hypothetical protein